MPMKLRNTVLGCYAKSYVICERTTNISMDQPRGDGERKHARNTFPQSDRDWSHPVSPVAREMLARSLAFARARAQNIHPSTRGTARVRREWNISSIHAPGYRSRREFHRVKHSAVVAAAAAAPRASDTCLISEKAKSETGLSVRPSGIQICER